MRLSELVKSDKFFRSVECFPPRTDEAMPAMLENIKSLAKYNLAFVSVTYGAGGSTQGRSLKVIQELVEAFEVMAHFTCVNCTVGQIDIFIKKLEELGINNLLALRGDVPSGMSKEDVLSDFQHADELVKYLKKITHMDIAVAAFPEVHPESPSEDHNHCMLIQKVNSGAELVITQLFLDNEKFYRFHDKLVAKGLTKPIIPGIMPVTNFSGIPRMIELSSATFPKAFYDKLEKHKDDEAAVYQLGIEYAIWQCQELKKFGVRGLHLYSLNRQQNVAPILQVI